MSNKRAITRLLVANRGEIALRVMRSCREMGIVSIGIYGENEEFAPHVRYSDEAVRLQSSAGVPYLDIDAVVQAAVRMRADAVHPGYGFLAENGDFAEAIEAAGIVFVGPAPDAIRAMGDKIASRKLADRAGVPYVPGTADSVADTTAATDAARDIGYPIAVKAAGGGGGRGFRVARTENDLPAAFEGASGEASRYFRNPEVYLERYLERPRHIEVQLMADSHGNVVALGERECSIQRRHQKLVEESPSTAIGEDLRQRLFAAAVALAREVAYVGAGTVEFLVDERSDFHFLEMNTRIQVEHTVTEMVTGIDLVREQIRVAAGEPLSFDQSSVTFRGWAIECRINAEDPGRDFAPAPGTVVAYREPVGFGVRVDGAVSAGDDILPAYDSMIAKLVTWGRDRPEAIERMTRALDDFSLSGVPTTIPFHRRVLASQAFRDGETTTSFLAENPGTIPTPTTPFAPERGAGESAPDPLSLLIEIDGRRFETTVRGLASSSTGSSTASRRPTRRSSSPVASNASQDDLVSPIHGTVIRVGVTEGENVEIGQMIAVVEAMKMENELNAHKSGVLDSIALTVGMSVSIGQRIATIRDAAGE